mmetsp:Transcript_10084/g.26019  ORF Transcript_10084/g.26019 Transcript_10084/m.26019 type:complete len:299 (-) Transcript_10084:696-1592(-)
MGAKVLAARERVDGGVLGHGNGPHGVLPGSQLSQVMGSGRSGSHVRRRHAASRVASHTRVMVPPPFHGRVRYRPDTLALHCLASLPQVLNRRRPDVHVKHIRAGRVHCRARRHGPCLADRHAKGGHHPLIVHSIQVGLQRTVVRHVPHHGPLKVHAVGGLHGGSCSMCHRWNSHESEVLRATHHLLVRQSSHHLLGLKRHLGGADSAVTHGHTVDVGNVPGRRLHKVYVGVGLAGLQPPHSCIVGKSSFALVVEAGMIHKLLVNHDLCNPLAPLLAHTIEAAGLADRLDTQGFLQVFP